MARPWRIRYAGAKYHVTVRGNGRQAVFHADDDYQRFIDQMHDGLEKDEVILYAYCLMPNHYHLLVETPRGNIQRFMQRLNTAYSMYHRYKRQLPGHCFQGRYGAKLVEGDEYIIRLTRYIHLNPVKVKDMEKADAIRRLACLNGYKWSSYLGYAGLREAEEQVDYRYLKLMGRGTQKGNRAAYRSYLERYVSKEDEKMGAALGISRYAIGDAGFVERVEEELDDVREDRGVYGDIKWPAVAGLEVDVVADAVASEYGVPVEALHGRGYEARIAKKVVLELACRLCDISQRQAGELFGYRGNGAVTKQRQQLKMLLEGNNALARKVGRIEKRLSKG